MATEILDFTDDVFMRQVKQAQSLANNAEQYKKFYNNELSEIDLEQQDILHYLELHEKMSGADLLKAACALRKICRKRRIIKRKLAFACELTSQATSKDKTILSLLKDPMGEEKKRKYHVKTNILKEVFGYEWKTVRY